MRNLLSIPLLVLVVSGIVWLLTFKSGSQGTQEWLIRICEVLFIAAAFALMFSLARITIG